MKNRAYLIPAAITIFAFLCLNSGTGNAISTQSKQSIISSEYNSQLTLSDTSIKAKKNTAKKSETSKLSNTIIENGTVGKTGTGTGIGSGGSINAADTMTLIK